MASNDDWQNVKDGSAGANRHVRAAFCRPSPSTAKGLSHIGFCREKPYM
jgi:hypothetical protein